MPMLYLKRLSGLLMLVLMISASFLQAQEAVPPTQFDAPTADGADIPPLTPSPLIMPLRYADTRLLPDMLRDEKIVLTSPLRIKEPTLRWLIPFAAASVVLIATDQAAINHNHFSNTTVDISRDFSDLGSKFPMVGAALTTYAIGRFTSNDTVRETGMLGGQAMFHAVIIAEVLKHITNRRLPNAQEVTHFWSGGRAWPSGHAMTFWAFSTVVAGESDNRPILKYGIYGLASVVSVSRFTGRVHYPSDILASTTFGYLIGRYVVKHHSLLHS